MSKRKVSVEDKIYAVNLYLDGKESQRRIADMFDVSLASVQQWIRNYESMGANAFTLKGNKKYSKELKQQAVLDYLAGYGSQDDICKKYGIRSKAKLQIWIKKYNGHEELKSSGTGGSIVMTKGRKITFEERVEIVQYCIAHDRNSAQTAEQFFDEFLRQSCFCMINNHVNTPEVICRFDHIIHIQHFFFYANSISFKGISGLIMCQATSLHMVRVIGQINLCLMINPTGVVTCLLLFQNIQQSNLFFFSFVSALWFLCIFWNVPSLLVSICLKYRSNLPKV